MATLQRSKRTAKRTTRAARAKRPAAKRPAAKRAASSRTNGNARSRAATSRRQPETLRLRSLSPSFTVNDLETSIAWYRDGLGFVVSERWEEGGRLLGVMMAAGTCSFYFSQDDFAKGRDREKGVGFRVYAETGQSVDALAERIRAFGGKIVSEPADMPWGSRSFAVMDPDGFILSFSESR